VNHAQILIVGLEIAQVGADLLTRKRTDAATAATEIVGQVVRLIPVDELRAHLDDFDRAAIDAAADVAQELKLSKENKP